jgi:hypothetical protein
MPAGKSITAAARIQGTAAASSAPAQARPGTEAQGERCESVGHEVGVHFVQLISCLREEENIVNERFLL